MKNRYILKAQIYHFLNSTYSFKVFSLTTSIPWSLVMKISQEQKEQNRKKLIKASVDLISEKGFKATSMRAIAKDAGFGEATIYNYFPTKEAILYCYYEDHVIQCTDILQNIDDFRTYNLQEQLQSLFNTSLSLYLGDREFVRETFPIILMGSSRDWPRLKPIRDHLLAAINDMIGAAAEVGEIPDQVFQDLIGQLFMDAYIGLVHYWLSDRSEDFNNTTVLVDRGLDLACAMLQAGVANKAFDLATFLFKSHILSKIDKLSTPEKMQQNIKRKFMEAIHER
jgi:AcrR family transcriptional regulator